MSRSGLGTHPDPTTPAPIGLPNMTYSLLPQAMSKLRRAVNTKWNPAELQAVQHEIRTMEVGKRHFNMEQLI